MKNETQVPFQALLDFLEGQGFGVADRNGSCVILRHSTTRMTVTINAPGEPLGAILLTRLFFDLGIINSDLRLRGKVPGSSGAPRDSSGDLSEQVKQFERRLLETALKENGGNISKVASLLGVSRPTIYEKLRTHKISVP